MTDAEQREFIRAEVAKGIANYLVSQRDAHLRPLGLSWPCTPDEIRRAYRTRCRRAHPDLGGSTNDFIELTGHYEAALQAVSEASGGG